jgi:hypothetical protein
MVSCWYGESGLKSEGTMPVFGSIVGELRLDSSVLAGEAAAGESASLAAQPKVCES